MAKKKSDGKAIVAASIELLKIAFWPFKVKEIALQQFT
jgi:hypothetical protein